jgi:hypothetical protein
MAEIYINCFDEEGWGEGTIRGNLEWDLEEFFGEAVVSTGGCGGKGGFTLDFELAEGEDMDSWATRLREYLQHRPNTGRSTYFDVLPDGWAPGQAKRRVEVFGTDRWITEGEPE